MSVKRGIGVAAFVLLLLITINILGAQTTGNNIFDWFIGDATEKEFSTGEEDAGNEILEGSLISDPWKLTEIILSESTHIKGDFEVRLISEGTYTFENIDMDVIDLHTGLAVLENVDWNILREGGDRLSYRVPTEFFTDTTGKIDPNKNVRLQATITATSPTGGDTLTFESNTLDMNYANYGYNPIPGVCGNFGYKIGRTNKRYEAEARVFYKGANKVGIPKSFDEASPISKSKCVEKLTQQISVSGAVQVPPIKCDASSCKKVNQYDPTPQCPPRNTLELFHSAAPLGIYTERVPAVIGTFPNGRPRSTTTEGTAITKCWVDANTYFYLRYECPLWGPEAGSIGTPFG